MNQNIPVVIMSDEYAPLNGTISLSKSVIELHVFCLNQGRADYIFSIKSKTGLVNYDKHSRKVALLSLDVSCDTNDFRSMEFCERGAVYTVEPVNYKAESAKSVGLSTRLTSASPYSQADIGLDIE